LALLIGLAGGVVLAAAAGARRTQTAYPRLVRQSRDADVLVGLERPGVDAFYDEVGRLPEVIASGLVAGMNLVVVDDAGRPDLTDDPTANASVDGRAYDTVFRPNLVAGRLPRRERVDEVLANPAMARLHHLDVGSTISALAFRQLPDDLSRLDVSEGSPVTVKLVGIGVLPPEVVPVSPRDSGPQFTVTPAFYRAYADPEHLAYDVAYVRVRPGTDMSRLSAEVDAVAAAHPDAGQVFFAPQADRRTAAERAINPQVVALAAFAGLAGLTALLVLGQESTDQPALRSLGMTPGQLLTLAILRVAVIASAGGVIAVAVAVVASPLFPIGPARIAETHPGVAVNTALLGIGFVAMVALLVLRVVVPAWRGAFSLGPRADDSALTAGPSRLAEAAARAGLPASTTAGVRMALEPSRGAARVPVRTTVAGTLLAITALVAAVTFGASLSHLVDTHRLYGQDWDVMYDAGFSVLPTGDVTALVKDNPSVAAFAGGAYGDITIGDRKVSTVGIDALSGSVFPTLVAGRPPEGPDEIVLGTKVASRLHRAVGDTVDVGVGGEPRPMRIVGRAVFPKLGRGSFSSTSLGEGAAVAAGALVQPTPDAPDVYNFLLIRWSQNPASTAGRADLLRGLRDLAAGCTGASGICLPLNLRPGVIDGYSRVQATPLVLAGLLGLLALATLAHTLVTSIRRRRRDLAILKTLGFVRRQVSAAVAWQSTVLAAIAAVIGVPLGVAAGRLLWGLFADQLGVAARARTPVVAVVVAVPAALLAANLIAAVPARIAARTRPAVVLRSE